MTRSSLWEELFDPVRTGEHVLWSQQEFVMKLEIWQHLAFVSNSLTLRKWFITQGGVAEGPLLTAEGSFRALTKVQPNVTVMTDVVLKVLLYFCLLIGKQTFLNQKHASVCMFGGEFC